MKFDKSMIRLGSYNNLEKRSDWWVDPSLGDCGAGPQRDLRLDHPVHKTPEVQDDEDEESMMWSNDNGFVISKIMDMMKI